MLLVEWEAYSQAYNLLSEKLLESNIDISLLDNVITAYERIIKSNNRTNLFTNPCGKNPSKQLDKILMGF
ncbi:MAG TPA: hypothetical protein PK127_09260 [Clostridiales bacterium]|nr:hypothetical protein [Clostridiales bacterium]